MGNLWIPGNDGQLFQSALGDQYSIEGISVVWESIHVQRVAQMDGEAGNRIQRHILDGKTLWIIEKLQSAKFGFDGDFPAAGGAQEQGVIAIANDFPRTRRQFGVVGDPPQESVSVQTVKVI